MPEPLILQFTGVTKAEYEAVNKQLGIDMHTGEGDWPAGLLSHAAGTADDGAFVVSEVWSSRADQDALMTSRLGAALAAGGEAAPHWILWGPMAGYHPPRSTSD